MSLFVEQDSDEEVVLNLNNVPDDDAPQPPDSKELEEPPEYPLIPRDEQEEENNLLDQVDPVDISLTLPLKFQQLILEDLIADDSLLILGKGLGMEPIVANLLHTLSAPATIANVTKRSLVILLNASEEDNGKIADELTELSWIDDCNDDTRENQESRRPFVVIRGEQYTPDKRKALYLQGGIMSVTSRIFIVDLLTQIVNPQLITGLAVLHAEKISDTSNESFIAHMYRQKNNWGFIKAFSDTPEPFATGYSPLHKKLKDLRLKRVLLWPRFHIDVTKSLVSKNTKSVTEVKVAMTESMRHIQTGIMACLKKCIEELRRKTPTLAIEYWSIENALDVNFVNSIHRILDPNWHRISYDTKQLVKDIKLLKDLLKCLMSYDAVAFYQMIQIVLEANRPSVDKKSAESPWLMAEESQAVITYGKKRVFDKDEYVLEEQPKWEQLAILLEDIVTERAHDATKTGPVLIMCSNDRVKRTLKTFLHSMRETEQNDGIRSSYSGRRMMMNMIQQYLDSQDLKKTVTSTIKQANTLEGDDESQELHMTRAFARVPISTKRRRTRGGAAVAAVNRLHSAPVAGDDIESKMNRDDVDMELMELDTLDDEEVVAVDDEDGIIALEDSIELGYATEPGRYYEYIDRENQVIVEKYSGKTDDIVLQELMPSFIIMFEPDLAFIRRVEVYQAVHRENPARTYFMYYSDSVEEQHHLTSIRKEKEAFTKLIREKSTLASHFESDEDFNKFHVRKSQVMNTRIAGGAQFRDSNQESQILVDTREFRAPLPGLLHRIGLKVIPLTLTVGDYILTPKVCVERKSIADLIGSFKSGRLYEQCARMSKYYDLPALLIEFDNNQSFSLEPFSETRARPSNIKATHPSSSSKLQEDIQRDLAALVINFPKIRILWSSSPYQTAELMLELKAGREEPDLVKAVNAGLSEEKQRDNVLLSNNIVTLLQNIPGITNPDYYNIMRKIKDVNKLMQMSKAELSRIVGEDLGDRIFEYLSENYKD